jgi:hypothetical protein
MPQEFELPDTTGCKQVACKIMVGGAWYQSVHVEVHGSNGWYEVCSLEDNHGERICDPFGAGPARKVRVTCYHIKPNSEPHVYIENKYLHPPLYLRPDQTGGLAFAVKIDSNDGGSPEDTNSTVWITWFW